MSGSGEPGAGRSSCSARCVALGGGLGLTQAGSRASSAGGAKARALPVSSLARI